MERLLIRMSRSGTVRVVVWFRLSGLNIRGVLLKEVVVSKR